MKIFSAEQIRQWDAYTIKNTPITSVDLMEKAARSCFETLNTLLRADRSIAIFCGRGNNGGDGLALARMLKEAGFQINVYLLSKKTGSADYEENLKRYRKMAEPQYLDENALPPGIEEETVIDAIFGTGLNKPVDGFYKEVIHWINIQKKYTVSIDLPSGMFPDQSSSQSAVVRADLILTFQAMKEAFFMPENFGNTGQVRVLDIGLSPEYQKNTTASYQTNPVFYPKSRSPFSHKGSFGNACLIAGSYGMMGAAVLASQGCLRSGVGKLTCICCEKGYGIVQLAVPEALCRVSGQHYVSNVTGLERFDVIGVGPGLGAYDDHKHLLEYVFGLRKPLVIDADALNVLSLHKELYDKIPAESILTPHPREFSRLFGRSDDDFQERKLALLMAEKYKIYIVLKGHYSMIATPEHGGFFNTTGNAGMATGGSGDVLTGIITGLLAQHYDAEEACKAGVYLHGLAGDLAAVELSENAMKASDICRYLGKAFLRLEKKPVTSRDFSV